MILPKRNKETNQEYAMKVFEKFKHDEQELEIIESKTVF